MRILCVWEDITIKKNDSDDHGDHFNMFVITLHALFVRTTSKIS